MVFAGGRSSIERKLLHKHPVVTLFVLSQAIMYVATTNLLSN